MKNTLNIIIFFCLVLLINCTSESNFELLESQKKSTSIVEKIIQISIPADSVGMQYYRRISTYFNDSVYYFIGYHEIINALDLYNISERKFVKRIELAEKGPNSINSINSIFIHNLDSIFIEESSSLVIIDTIGKIRRRINLRGEEIFNNNKIPYGIFTSTLNFSIKYSSKNNTVLLYYAPREFEYFSNKYLMTSFLGEISLANITPKITLLPLKYSSYYLKGKDIGFGSMFQPNVTIYKDLIVYNFPIESNIYTYNLYTGDTHKFGAKSVFSNNLVEPYSENQDRNTHLVKSTIFLKTIYDPYKKLFYRIHWGNCENKNNSMELNTLSHKPLYLMVFDQDFNVLKEIKLEDNKYLPFGYFLTDEGLFISSGHPNNEDVDFNKLQFDLFIINHEE